MYTASLELVETKIFLDPAPSGQNKRVSGSWPTEAPVYRRLEHAWEGTQ